MELGIAENWLVCSFVVVSNLLEGGEGGEVEVGTSENWLAHSRN